jgi:hypothetical protein
VILKPKALQQNDSYFQYEIDQSRSVRILRKGHELPGFDLEFEETRERSLWASLIYTSDARSDLVATYVTEHRRENKGELRVVRHRDVPTVVLPDEEVAELTGWPRESIKVSLNQEELAKEVILKYQIGGWNWPASASRTAPWLYDWTIPFPWGNGPYCRYYYLEPGEHHHAFCYLHEGAKPSELATLLREAAALASNQKDRDSTFCYLFREAQTEDVIRALEECIWYLRNSPRQQGMKQ